MRNLSLIAASCMLLSACSSGTWENIPNGFIVTLKGKDGRDAKKVKVEAVTNSIVHVIASPGDRFSETKSLMVSYRDLPVPEMKVLGNSDSVSLSTSDLIATVSVRTGNIAFRDNRRNVLIREPDKGGKVFSPVIVEGNKGFSMHQVFESPDDEAFYGLGQHQSDEFNHKGLNEDLYQYNTKVSLPFVLSNRNYGILWDNYSLTKFGDPRDYSQVSLFTLYDEEGKEGGLTATYASQKDTVRRREASVDYENLETVKNFPEKFPFYGSLITWKGEIEPKESGLFQFRLYYAGYTKVFINNELVVPERWRTAWNPNTYKFRMNMEKGKKYPITIEWKPDGGISYIGFKALSPRPESDQGALSLYSEMGDQIDYYFIKGNTPDEVISGYRILTGKAQVMPKWALGYWQSRERYKSQTELVDVVKEYRKRNIPLDNIVLDWSYWPVESWGSHEFDPRFFPDPAAMVDDVHKLNAHIMISVWPKFYYTTEHFKEFDKKGWMYRQAIKDSIRDWIGKGYIGSFYDAYNPDARLLFWEQVREHIFTKGFDAWWMDASEPDILSNAGIEYRKKLSTPTALGPSTRYFNAYALVNAMAIYDGQRSADTTKRVFLLTRSGFPGLQRYSTATWSGDIATRWEDMKAQIPAGLNFAMSGIPYWTFDIGGFCVENRYTRAREGSEDIEEWRELNARWYQFGSFCPLFRSHGQYPFREVFNIAPEGHPVYNSMVYYDRLRYSFMPYIYSLAGMTYLEDYTIMRAMVMDFSSDRNTLNIGDQYMFGPSLLVAPVYSYKARSRQLYLPGSCGWYDLYTGSFFDGGQTIRADAPLEKMPLFVREGAIIPVGPEIMYTDQKPADPLMILVYGGKDGEFTLYEDDGTSYNYEKGEYSTIKLSYDNSTGKLTINKRNGRYPGMPATRTFNIVFIDKDLAVGFNPHMKAHRTLKYKGEMIEVTK